MSTDSDDSLSSLFPAVWVQSPGFRSTFLAHFTERGHAAVLAFLSDMLSEYAHELASQWPDQGEPPAFWETRAAAADLKWIAAYLTAVGREREESALAPEEKVVSELARKVAGEVARLAKTLEEAVGKPPAKEEA